MFLLSSIDNLNIGILTNAVVKKITNDIYDFILVNYDFVDRSICCFL